MELPNDNIFKLFLKFGLTAVVVLVLNKIIKAAVLKERLASEGNIESVLARRGRFVSWMDANIVMNYDCPCGMAAEHCVRKRGNICYAKRPWKKRMGPEWLIWLAEMPIRYNNKDLNVN